MTRTAAAIVGYSQSLGSSFVADRWRVTDRESAGVPSLRSSDP